jgi:hypothetical protein
MAFESIMKKLNKSGKFSNKIFTKPPNLFEIKSETVKFEIYSLSYLYIVLLIGILSNLLFLIIILKKKNEKICIKSLNKVKQPILSLVIAIIIGDIFYLFNELNEWLLSNNIYYSINGVCQLLSYIFNYFLVLNECHFITANIFLINYFCFKKTKIILNEDRLNSSLTERLSSISKRKDSNHLQVEAISVFESPKYTNISSVSVDQIYEFRNSFSSFLKRKESRLQRNRTRSEISIKMIKSELKKLNYSKLVFYEKVIISFYSFIFMYLLSFFFWIQQVYNYKIPSNYNSNRIVIISISLCEANKMYINFINYYKIIFNIIRIVILIITFAISILYVKKFNNYFINFMWKTFKKPWISEAKNKNIFLKTLSIDSYSSTAINLKIDYNLNDNLKQKNLLRHSLHVKFVQFYSIMAIFYSLFKIFPVIFQLVSLFDEVKYNRKNNSIIYLQTILNFATRNLLDQLDKKLMPQNIKFQYYDAIAHFMEIIAHSCKFYLFILVSYHFIFFFKKK